ncbi:MAG: hypothetical protein R3B69_03110 [Candidatus Paceibacterota bacterium]
MDIYATLAHMGDTPFLLGSVGVISFLAGFVIAVGLKLLSILSDEKPPSQPPGAKAPGGNFSKLETVVLCLSEPDMFASILKSKLTIVIF